MSASPDRSARRGMPVGDPPRTPSAGARQAFTLRVRQQFDRHADDYAARARLQRAVAWRLARACAGLPLPPGPCADLGAGTGLLSLALQRWQPGLTLRQLDLSPQLLARNPLALAADGGCVWDLNRGRPPGLEAAALLASNFALQWLADPTAELEQWCDWLRPGGWLALAVPGSGSLSTWQAAAQAAQVPCTALPLPDVERLIQVAAGPLQLRLCRRLRYSSATRDGREGLRQIRDLGAGASPAAALSPGQLRALLRHWPSGPALTWEVLLLLGRRR